MQMLQHPGLNLTNQLFETPTYHSRALKMNTYCFVRFRMIVCNYLRLSWTPLRSRFDPKDMKHCDSSVLSPSVLLSFKALQQAIRRILWGLQNNQNQSNFSIKKHWHLNHLSKGLKVDTHYILPLIDKLISQIKIRCWQSSFFELLCLPSTSLQFQYVSIMRTTFWSLRKWWILCHECNEFMSFGYGHQKQKKHMASHLQLCFCTDSCLQLSILGTVFQVVKIERFIFVSSHVFVCIYPKKKPCWSPNQFSHFTLNFVKFTFCLRWKLKKQTPEKVGLTKLSLHQIIRLKDFVDNKRCCEWIIKLLFC